jgi:hypothetical protein
VTSLDVPPLAHARLRHPLQIGSHG